MSEGVSSIQSITDQWEIVYIKQKSISESIRTHIATSEHDITDVYVLASYRGVVDQSFCTISLIFTVLCICSLCTPGSTFVLIIYDIEHSNCVCISKNMSWIELRRCLNVCLSSIIFFLQMQSHPKSSHLSHITALSAPASFHNTSNYNSRVRNSAIHLTHDTNVASMCRTYQITLTTDLTMLVSMPSPDTPRDCATSLTIFSETYITFWDSRLIKQCICRQESFRGPGRHCRPSFL